MAPNREESRRGPPFGRGFPVGLPILWIVRHHPTAAATDITGHCRRDAVETLARADVECFAVWTAKFDVGGVFGDGNHGQDLTVGREDHDSRVDRGSRPRRRSGRR